MIRQTHTYAVLEVSKEAFNEIKKKLREAGYDHAFIDDVIDMHGIALSEETKKEQQPKRYRPGDSHPYDPSP